MTHTYSPSSLQRLALGAYNALILILLPVLVVSWIVGLFKNDRTVQLKRLQRFSLNLPNFTPNGLWFHCVSVGEVVVASQVIKAIRDTQPDIPITVTTTTPTGAAQVESIFKHSVIHCYLPYDLPFMMKRLLRNIQPKQVLVTEVELWPNLIHQCWKQAIPIALINGRMTNKSTRGYKKLTALVTPMLKKLTCICAQGEHDCQNYLALGASSQQVVLTQNIKYDLKPAADQQTLTQLAKRYNPRQRPLFLAGSTHAPEESVLLEAFSTIKQRLDLQGVNPLLIIVPRHPQRFDEVFRLCQQSPFSVARSSHGVSGDEDVVMVDEMGVLSSLFGLATLCFVGGSLAQRGGHNALEASVYAKPVLMGPSIYNNAHSIRNLEMQGALNIVNDAQDIVTQAMNWFEEPERAKQAGHAGLAVIKANQGAITNTLSALSL